jgi:hypothetical protein
MICFLTALKIVWSLSACSAFTGFAGLFGIVIVRNDANYNIVFKLISKIFYFNCESAYFTNLFATSARVTLNVPKRMVMFFISPLLPHGFSGLPPQVTKGLFKLLVLLTLLLGCPPVIFCV